MATKKTDDTGAEEAQAVADEAADKGYIGFTPDPFPNEAYSLKSGPSSPSAAEVADALKSAKEGDK